MTIATFFPFAPPSSARSCTPHAGFPVFDRVASDAPVIPKPHGLANHSGAVATPTNGRRSVAKVDASCAMPTAGTTANASSASRATAAVSATGLAPAYVMVRPPTRPCALARSKRARAPRSAPWPRASPITNPPTCTVVGVTPRSAAADVTVGTAVGNVMSAATTNPIPATTSACMVTG